MNFYRFLINVLKNLLAISTDKAAQSPLNLALNDDCTTAFDSPGTCIFTEHGDVVCSET